MLATPVTFPVPAHACDCHTHIFGDPAKFPFAPKRGYTPPPATPADMRAFHRSLGVERVVIVTPSVYGTDNAATVYGLREIGKTARGIAVIGDRTSDQELAELDRAGVRGIRLNLANAGINDPVEGRKRFQAVARRMQARGWHIQIFARLDVVAGLKDAVLESPVPVVFDHFGGAKTALGVAQPGFAELVAMVKSGRAYVKISGAYRASQRGPDFADAAPFAQALIAANADRVVWGTDWPHPDSDSGRPFTEMSPPVAVDDGRLLSQLAVWASDPGVRQKILVENPARLYAF